VLRIVRPGSGLDAGGVAFALCAVVAGVVYPLLSRVLAASETTVALLFYTALVGAAGFGAFLPVFWPGVQPTLAQFLLFLSMGGTGGLGHSMYTAAYRHAPASLLAPMNYLQLLWAGLLGGIVFGHVPDHLSIIGMSVVALSGALVALKARRPRVSRASSDLSTLFPATRTGSAAPLSMEKLS
jgi:drug/metabolite transporter (DMT)-like permease